MLAKLTLNAFIWSNIGIVVFSKLHKGNVF